MACRTLRAALAVFLLHNVSKGAQGTQQLETMTATSWALEVPTFESVPRTALWVTKVFFIYHFSARISERPPQCKAIASHSTYWCSRDGASEFGYHRAWLNRRSQDAASPGYSTTDERRSPRR
jgi:hypothetical protein